MKKPNVDSVNAEIREFVDDDWSAHKVTEAKPTIAENVCKFDNDTARISFSSIGNLHHEICHAIVEKCMKSASEPEKEGVCDAYKFLRMEEYGPSSYDAEDQEWHSKIQGYKKLSSKEILVTSHDPEHDIKHAIPASRLLRKCNSLDDLYALRILMNLATES
jgi:hypothetical protein